ncbi:hypothetical protein IT397_03170 [Candidatus Nomurabacteria bacterium]|nr:hypothetical protein [Candidatus Nomurabacteria bacterium]
MPRYAKEKFFIYAPARRGPFKGKRLLGVNDTYEGGTDKITLKDLVEFLSQKGISLDRVTLPAAFTTAAKA